MSSIGDFIVSPDLIGSKTETAPATDTASSGLNGRLQRIAQRITSLLGLLPASLGQKTMDSSLAVTLASNDDLQGKLGTTSETAPATDTAAAGLNGRLQRIAQRLTSLLALYPTLVSGRWPVDGSGVTQPAQLIAGTAIVGKVGIDQTTPGTTNLVSAAGYGFDVVVAPTVTNGAYSPNDIMGGLMTFTVARVNDEAVLINEIQISLKSAVTPSFLIVLLEADPTSTTKTDNAAYSLNVADVFKVRAALPVNSLAGYLTDHGTPNTIRLPNLNLAMRPVSGGRDIYMLLVDLSGVTLTSTGDVQVRVCGLGA